MASLDHISYLIKNVSSLTGILYRVKCYLPIDCKKQIYFALVNSIIIYCIEVYANVTQSILKPLIVKCNRLLRLLQAKPRRTPVLDLYSSFSTLPVDKLFQFYTLKLIHKCVYNSYNLPSSIVNYFIKTNTVHSHLTRRSGFLFIQSDSSPASIAFYGPVLWNKLLASSTPSIALQNDSILVSFLRACKDFLLTIS